MPLQPKVTGDDITDQWMEEVTYELNNLEVAAAALANAAEAAGLGQEVVPVYAVDADGTDQSLNLGSRNFVYYSTVSAGEDPELPLPDGTVFVQFRGEQTRVVEITVHTVPSSYVNARGETKDYTDYDMLEVDWAVGAVEPEDFPTDPDGIDFGYGTEVKMLMARVREASESVDPADGYSDPILARAFDYRWTRNGMDFSPVYLNSSVDFPFLFITPVDITDEGGRSSQFFCNIVQL